jgi:hypothetical protein
MGLGDFIMLIDKLGVFGVIITLIFLLVMFMGALVDIYQFLWVIKRVQNRRVRALHSKIRAQVLNEIFEERKK